jgi:superfamily II DNA or RNA helicase
MSTCRLIIKDEVNVKFEDLDLDTRRKLHKEFKQQVPYARFLPSFKLGRWDGSIPFFGLGGTTYFALLEQILPMLEADGWYVEVTDLRETRDIQFDLIDKDYLSGQVWPQGHVCEGQPIELRDYQVETINNFLENPQCIQEVATGAGKTIVTAVLSKMCEKYGRTIVVVPNKSLVVQTEEDYRNIGLDVGVFYGDRKEIDKTHTIATWQSLNALEKKAKDGLNQEEQAELLDGVNTIIIDEVHQAKADVLKRLLGQQFARCAIRWGLTGTVPKAKYEFEALRCSIGEVINKISAKDLQDKGILSKCHVNIMQLVDHTEFRSYQEELKYLMSNTDRLEKIAKVIRGVSQSGNTLVLCDRLSAGNHLQSIIKDSVFISGGTDLETRKEHYDEVSTAKDKVIIATYGVASVGINIPRIFNLVLIEPGKSFVRVIQSIGRGIRKAQDKDFVQIWDITSTCKFAKRHLTERKKFYKEAQYPFNIDKVE